MTIQELYTEIGGNYAHAQQIMKMDKMISKYLLKLTSSGVCEKLKAASETLDAAAMFESAHAMKGVCANLGLDALAEAVGEVTEEFRPGAARSLTDDEVRAKLASIFEMYAKTEAGIKRYQESL